MTVLFGNCTINRSGNRYSFYAYVNGPIGYAQRTLPGYKT